MAQQATETTFAPTTVAHAEERTYSKVTARIVPFLFICYLAAYLDRVNVGFAKLQMLNELKFSETIYGLGAGIFFLGYVLFEVPSNIVLHKVGARLWIARIMITWGLISGAMAFITTPTMFYILRFLLGRGSGLHPRHPALSHLLVPGEPARPHHRDISRGHPDVEHHRRAVVRLDPFGAQRRARDQRLAVAFHRGNRPLRAAGHRHPVLPR